MTDTDGSSVESSETGEEVVGIFVAGAAVDVIVIGVGGLVDTANIEGPGVGDANGLDVRVIDGADDGS